MTLAAYQDALCALAFGREPPAALADFAVYREMIRARLFGMAQVAFRRSWALVGVRPCDASFARYLATQPPTSPLVREVIADFAPFAVDDELGDEAPFARDLLRFEAAKWRASDAPFAPPGALAEVDFEGTLVLNPTLSVLMLAHSVDQDVPAPAAPHALLVYRRADEDDVHWYRASSLFGALLQRAQGGDYAFGALLREALSARALVADEALLSELAGELALAVERSVLLGVRA